MAAPEMIQVSGAAAFSSSVIFGLTTIKCVALPQRDSAVFHFVAPCFRRRVRESASMAMNSEFVGLPLMFDTV